MHQGHVRPEDDAVKPVKLEINIGQSGGCTWFVRQDRASHAARSVSRVWHAIDNATEFGRWFGINLDGNFVVGKPITATFNEGLNEAAIVDFREAT
ncbi:MAG: hypothetical protein NVS3B20_01500 [Polyangiales bacterium]